MARLIVHDRARDDVDEIAGHILQDNPAAAVRFLDAAERAFELLTNHPGAGPRFDPPLHGHPDLRFWPITRFRNYLVIYRPLPEGAEIIRIIHGARDIPASLRETP